MIKLQFILFLIQIILGLSLITFVLLQQKGSGVGGVFGGESVAYRSRRGVQKVLHYATIISAVFLCLVSLYSVVLGR